MEKLSYYSFVAASIALGLACLLYLAYVLSGLRVARMQTVDMPGRTGALGLVVGPRHAAFGRYGSILGWLGFAFLTAWLVSRTLATGHGPFANMHEFAVAFAWGILGAYYWFERSYHQRVLGLLALPLATGMMLYAATVPSTIEPLVPALQNNLLLTVHVAVAIVAYGSFSIAFGAAVLFLIQPAGSRWGLPEPDILDEIGHKAVVIGFPFLTATIVLGAIWAEVAWGSYWSWDPKESASLVTWLIYAAYLHARVVRGWTGHRAAILLLIGFLSTLLTYFGNYFFGGLHSYAGLG
jgi:ABC-type transport system involved in cytochrome c biogenesis permease subunit